MQARRFPETAVPAGRLPASARPHQGPSRENDFPMGNPSRVVPPTDLLQRVRTEYVETASLHLTPSQAQRLFGLDPLMCRAVLEALLLEHFLRRTSAGLFVQAPGRS